MPYTFGLLNITKVPKRHSNRLCAWRARVFRRKLRARVFCRELPALPFPLLRLRAVTFPLAETRPAATFALQPRKLRTREERSAGNEANPVKRTTNAVKRPTKAWKETY